MSFLTLLFIWYILGFIPALFIVFKATDQITLEDVTISLWASVLGPIYALMQLSSEFGDKVLYRKKH